MRNPFFQEWLENVQHRVVSPAGAPLVPCHVAAAQYVANRAVVMSAQGTARVVRVVPELQHCWGVVGALGGVEDELDQRPVSAFLPDQVLPGQVVGLAGVNSMRPSALSQELAGVCHQALGLKLQDGRGDHLAVFSNGW